MSAWASEGVNWTRTARSNRRDAPLNPMSRVFIVTGEPSGDAIGAGVAARMSAMDPALEREGIGSSHMQREGVALWANSGDWAAIGITQALPMAARLLALQRRLKAALASHPPDALVLVDFGAFNVRLGAWARQQGIFTAWIMPPGSWRRDAGKPRLQRLAAAADLFLTPFPWNATNLRSVGARAERIGHPALDLGASGAAPEAARALRPRTGRLIALLPGSRAHEVDILAPKMAEVARRWPFEDDRFVIPRAPAIPKEALQRAIGGTKSPPNALLMDSSAASVLAAADLAVACSGTVTLEAAIAGVPTVVVYDGPPVMRLEWRLRRRWLNIENIALPNVIAGKRVMPELLAEESSVENVSRELMRLASDDDRRAVMRRAMDAVREHLGPPGGLEAAARHVLWAAHILPPEERI